MKVIGYGRHSISPEDIEAVVQILRGDFLTQGPSVEAFQDAFKNAVGAPHALACANGTAALHLCTLAAGLGKGDRVLVAPITFVASANCARFVGADVAFADIREDTLTLDPALARQALENAEQQGRPFKALVTVDLAGHPCDMAAFKDLKDRYRLIWIQDACHSLGASWTDKGGVSRQIGEWAVPDFTVYSFHPVKPITTGEGGMVTTHSPLLAEALTRFRSHGIEKSPGRFVFPEEAFDPDGGVNPWYYEMQSLGFNYRLTDIQAALGVSQLRRLPRFIARRREIVAAYRHALGDVPGLAFPVTSPGVEHAYHLAVVRIDFAGRRTHRSLVMGRLRERGVGTQVHYIPIPMMPFYSNTATMTDLPRSLQYYREAISLPCFPDMTEEDVERVVRAVREVLG